MTLPAFPPKIKSCAGNRLAAPMEQDSILTRGHERHTSKK